MKKEFRIVDEVKKTVQITTLDERWYGDQVNDQVTGLPTIVWKPSITFITGSYPKGIAYMRWLADKGYDKAEEVKMEAGDRGTIVHHAIEKLMLDGVLVMDEKIKDREGVEREMTPDEYYCVITFSQWYEANGRPKKIAVEQTVESKLHGYAGTLDYIFEIDGQNVLLDIKTSKYIWPSHELQVSALKQACIEENIKVDKIAILQVGYTANKTQHYKFTEVKDQFDLFLSTKAIWAKEHSGDKPLQRDYPMVIVIKEMKPEVEPIGAVDLADQKIDEMAQQDHQADVEFGDKLVAGTSAVEVENKPTKAKKKNANI